MEPAHCPNYQRNSPQKRPLNLSVWGWQTCLSVNDSREHIWENWGRCWTSHEPTDDQNVTRKAPAPLGRTQNNICNNWRPQSEGRANQRNQSIRSKDVKRAESSFQETFLKERKRKKEGPFLPFGQYVAELFHRAEATSWNRNQNLSRLAGFPAHSCRCAWVF